VQKDLSIDKKPITLGGKVYPKGLGTHAPSEIVYNLDGKYATFTADVGIDDETRAKARWNSRFSRTTPWSITAE